MQLCGFCLLGGIEADSLPLSLLVEEQCLLAFVQLWAELSHSSSACLQHIREYKAGSSHSGALVVDKKLQLAFANITRWQMPFEFYFSNRRCVVLWAQPVSPIHHRTGSFYLLYKEVSSRAARDGSCCTGFLTPTSYWSNMKQVELQIIHSRPKGQILEQNLGMLLNPTEINCLNIF